MNGLQRGKRSAAAVAGLALGALITTAPVAGAANASVNVNSIVLPVFDITCTAPLNFGTFVSGPTGTIVIDEHTGARTQTGGLTLVSSVPPAQYGSCIITNALAGHQYSVVMDVNTTVSGPGAPMLVDFITLDGGLFNIVNGTDTTPATADGTIEATGTDQFSIGGTLHVGLNQTPGNYTGTLGLTVNYS